MSAMASFANYELGSVSPWTARESWPDNGSPSVSMLLCLIQVLVDQHPHKHQQKYPSPDAKGAHGDGKPADLGQQFRLLIVHVRTRVIQKQLVIPVHRECTLVDQEEDQTNCKSPEYHSHNSQHHKPPRPVSNLRALTSSLSVFSELMTLLLQAFGALRSTQCARASVFVYLAVLCGNSSVTNPAEWNGNER